MKKMAKSVPNFSVNETHLFLRQEFFLNENVCLHICMYICLNVYICMCLLYTRVKVCILSLLVIYRNCICEFAYSLERICNFICKISICSAFTVINRHKQSGNKPESLNTQEHPSCG